MIRTIKEPKQSMIEDPLRVMRAFRFSNQLDFDIEDSLKEVISLDQVRDKTLSVLSRERIATEVFKTFLHNHNGTRLHKTLSLMIDLGYFPIVFLGSSSVGSHILQQSLDSLAHFLRLLFFFFLD